MRIVPNVALLALASSLASDARAHRATIGSESTHQHEEL
jgi:hypothetical protein